MRNVLLVNPHWKRPGLRDRVRRDSGVLHPGLLQIAETLLHEEIPVTVLDLGLDEILDKERLTSALNKSSPGLVGITATTCSYPGAVAVARMIKELDPALPIIGGGIHFGLNAEEVFRGPDPTLFDYICLSEGERPLAELARALDQRRTPDVPGLVRRVNGQAIRTADVRPMSTPTVIDEAWQLLDRSHYTFRDKRKLGVAINTMRGCRGNCTFCPEPYRWPSVTSMSAEEIVRQFRIVKERIDPAYIFIGDSNFCHPVERLRSFVRLMKEEGPHVPFNFLARLDDILEFRDLLPDLRSIGCFLIHYGGERTTDAGQQYLRKGESAGITEEATRAVQEADILAKATFIFGMPFDDRETMRAMIDDIYRINPDIVSFGCYTPIPGTPSFERDSQHLSTRDLSYFTVNYAVCDTESMRQPDVESYLDEEYRRFWLSDRHRERLSSVRNEDSRRLLSAYFDFIERWNGP